jgi:hypothetical protein
VDFFKHSLQIDWTARYELRSILSGHIESSVEVVLPAKNITPLLAERQASKSDLDSNSESAGHILGQRDKETEIQQRTISLPVAMSSVLRRVVIFDMIVQLPSLALDKKAVFKDTPTPLTQIFDISTKFNYKPFRNDVKFHPDSYEIPFEAKFSPSGKYLVLIRESVEKARKAKISYGVLWRMQILSDKNFESSSGPEYTCIASSTFFAVPEIAFLSPSRGVAFHPTLPRLAFPQVFGGLPQTYIWEFEEPVV